MMTPAEMMVAFSAAGLTSTATVNGVNFPVDFQEPTGELLGTLAVDNYSIEFDRGSSPEIKYKTQVTIGGVLYSVRAVKHKADGFTVAELEKL